MGQRIMHLTGNIFSQLANKDAFHEFVSHQYYTEAEKFGVLVTVDKSRCFDAFFQWQQDIDRISQVEQKIKEPDHIKRCAHLIYWLRRFSPVVGYTEVDETSENQGKAMILEYGNEYLAFDLGYRICRLFECFKNERNLPQTSFPLSSAFSDVPSTDFVETMIHFLKVKNVSPHAIFLIMKAIFLRP